MNRLRAATVAVAVAVAVAVGRCRWPLPLLLTWIPVDGATSPVPKSDKKRLLFERSELQALPDFGAGGVGSPRKRTAIFGVAFSCPLLLARQEKWVGCRAETRLGRPAGHKYCFIRQPNLAAKPPLPWLCSAAERKAPLQRMLDG